MPRARIRAVRVPPPTGLEWAEGRARGLDAALTAAGEPGLQATYDMYYGGHADRLFKDTVMRAGLTKVDRASWPCETSFLDGLAGEVFRDGDQAFYRFPNGTLALIWASGDWFRMSIAGQDDDEVAETSATFASLYPATYLSATDSRVPITFWSLGRHGPESRLRLIDASPWQGIRENYPPGILSELDRLMGDFEPGAGGLLLLWQGPPGTGKTWALRALVSEWLPWAEFSFITDPDAFFVADASYMVDVLLADSYEAISPELGIVEGEKGDGSKWRVLILEDTGELLATSAKEKYGQGLSRLLNVVDGMIGQGLKVLVLVTTNDELGELTPAVRRPGRCASQLVFPPFSAAEASAWLGRDVSEPMTVAEMYASRADGTDAFADEGVQASGSQILDVGELVPIPGTDGRVSVRRADLEAVLRMVEMAKANSVVQEVRRVAEEHADAMVGYGETAYDPENKRVLYVCGDWTETDEIDQAFLDIDGVEDVQHEAEGLPDGWWDAEVVYPDDPPRWVTEPPDKQTAALDAALELASRPLRQ